MAKEPELEEVVGETLQLISDLDGHVRDHYKGRDKLVDAMAGAAFGVALPTLRTFRDKDGNLWELRLRAEVKLLERALTEEETKE